MRTSIKMVLGCLIGIVGWTGIGQADIYMKYKMHTDGFQMMGQTQPAKDETQEMWVAKEMTRTDGKGGQTSIMRVDQKKIYFIDNQNKSYVEMPLEFEKMAQKSMDEDPDMDADEKAQAMQFMKGMMQGMSKMQLTVKETGEKKKIGKWNCEKYIQTLTTAMGPSESELWATQDLKIDSELFSKMQASGMMMMPGMQENIAEIKKEMSKIKGVMVYSVSTATMMNTTVKTTQELLDYTEKNMPADFYSPPKGYSKKTQ